MLTGNNKEFQPTANCKISAFAGTAATNQSCSNADDQVGKDVTARFCQKITSEHLTVKKCSYCVFFSCGGKKLVELHKSRGF
jgi:hypothetical protein